ncbi:hypothetical protein CL657_02060 [bacterium]|nr:hypothetical protein [bacterium]
MRYFSLILTLLLFSMSLHASDIVVNIDPNPVQLESYFRISVVSEKPIKEAILLVGDDMFPLKKVSDQLFKIKLKAFNDLDSNNVFVNVVFTSSKVQMLPVQINVSQGNVYQPGINVSIDSDNFNSVSIDNTKLEIEYLEDKLDLLDQKNKRLNNEIANLNQRLKNQNQLDLTKKEIAQEQKKLDQLTDLLKQEMISKQNSIMELKKQMELFNLRQDEFNKREQELTSLSVNLSKQSEELLNKEQKIAQEKLLIQQKETAINQQRSLVKTSQLEVVKDRNMVDKMKNEIYVQKKELEKRNKQIRKKEKDLDTVIASIETNKSNLNSKEKQLKGLSIKINSERQNLMRVSEKLDVKKKQLDLEKNKFYQEKSEKEKNLKQAQKNVNEFEKKLLGTVSELSRLEKDYLDRSSQFLKEKERLDNDRLNYEKEKKAFDLEYSNLKLMESKIAVRVEILNNLGQHIDSQLSLLHKQISESEQTKKSYELDMSGKVGYLNNLTKLIEKRANKMEYRNKRLIVKNKQLSQRLASITAPDYRYSFSPYFGVRISDDSKSEYDEYGINFSAFLEKGYSVTLGVGTASYMKNSNSNHQNIVNESMGYISLAYLLNPKEQLGFYIRSLVSRPLKMAAAEINFGAGLDLKYHHNAKFSSFFGGYFLEAPYFSFGVEKYIIPTFKKSIAFDNQKNTPTVDEFEIENQATFDSNNDVFLSFNSIRPYFCFFPKSQRFDDVSSSWYEASVNRTSSLGLFDLKNSTVFNPKGYLTFKDISYSLVWARYIDQMVKPAPIKVEFSIVSDIQQSVFLSFYIFDKNGNKIKQLVDKKEFFIGDHSFTFDPQFSSLQEGSYTLVCDVFVNKISKAKSVGYNLESILITSYKEDFIINGGTSLTDFPEIKANFNAKETVPYIKQAIDYNWLSFDKNDIDLFSNQAVTRLDFIEIVGRFLLEEGAQNRNIEVDLTYYKDLSLIPKEKQKFLKEYVIELGYGGDQNQKLNPYQYLTRAEFAVILDRLLLWKQKMLDDKNINLNFSELVVN